MTGVNHKGEYIYVHIFEDKLDLNRMREFLSSNFTITSDGSITIKNTDCIVAELVVVCKSFQNSHVKEFKVVSHRIQLMREDFFNVNITEKAPGHRLADPNTVVLYKSSLPVLKLDDPMCVFYNFAKSDLIQITRSDGEICYRVVK
jgi:DNA-directed RNA polymerase subunit H (RpoH/RPB5)